MMAKIIQWVIEALVRIGVAQKEKADAEKAKALEKTLDSVDKSLEVEKRIRDDQKAIDKDIQTVKGTDGGLNFDSFNSGTKIEEKLMTKDAGK